MFSLPSFRCLHLHLHHRFLRHDRGYKCQSHHFLPGSDTGNRGPTDPVAYDQGNHPLASSALQAHQSVVLHQRQQSLICCWEAKIFKLIDLQCTFDSADVSFSPCQSGFARLSEDSRRYHCRQNSKNCDHSDQLNQTESTLSVWLSGWKVQRPGIR